MRRRVVIAAVGAAGVAGAALAQGEADAPEWYERVDGILAIPVTLIGIPLTWVLIRKTNLEARKTKLEIIEKERKLADAGGLTAEQEGEVLRPILRESIIATVLFRFVLLYLVLQLWGIVASLYGTLVSGAAMLLFSSEAGKIMDHPLARVGFVLVQNLPNIVSWGIVIALGWPLLKDVNRYLRIVDGRG